MATVTTFRKGRTWYGRPTYAVRIFDPTGRITFHGYGRRVAETLATVLGPIVGQRPVGALAEILARELALHQPAPGEVWTERRRYLMVAAVYLAFSAAVKWAFPNPLRIAFVIGAAAVVFQVAVLVEHARHRN